MVVSSGICCCLLGPQASPETRGLPLEGAEATPGPDAKLLTNEAHPLAKQLLRRRIAHSSFHRSAVSGNLIDSTFGIVRSDREGMLCHNSQTHDSHCASRISSSVLSIREDILQSLGHPVVSALGLHAARSLDLSDRSVGVVVIGHEAPWRERCELITHFRGTLPGFPSWRCCVAMIRISAEVIGFTN